MPTAAGLVGVVAALVLGILGMHSLAQHGAAPAPGHHQTSTPTGVDPHAAHPPPDHEPIATGAAPSSPGHADHGSMSDTVMLCAAMLLAAAAGLLPALGLVRIAHVAPLSLRPLFRLPVLHATARAGTGPPSLWELSVNRC